MANHPNAKTDAIQALGEKQKSFLQPPVELYTIKLGPTDTPMTVDHEKNGTFISAQRAAELIDRGLKRRSFAACRAGPRLGRGEETERTRGLRGTTFKLH